MNSLQEALKSLEQTLSEMPSQTSWSVTPQPGLTKNDGQTIMLPTTTPREQAITVSRAKSAMQWLRQLKQYRKRRLVSSWVPMGENPVYRSEYTLPEGMTTDSVIKALTELIRPCSPTVVKHFVTLQAFKPFFDNDPERIGIIYDRLYDDIKDMPEVAVVMALDDLRNSQGKWFPLDLVLPEVTSYKELIYDALDFFQVHTNTS